MTDKLALFPTTLSVTSDVDVFVQCPYKWSLNRVLWYRKRNQDYHRDLAFGAANAKVHQLVLEAYYKDFLPEEEAIQVGIDFINTEFSLAYQLSGSDEPVKNPTKMVEALQRYFKEIPLDRIDGIVPFLCSDLAQSIEKSFYLELPFTHPETGQPLLLSAKPDMLGIEAYTGKTILIDDKTAGQSGNGSSEGEQATMWRYKLGNQMVQYAKVINSQKDKIGFNEVTHGEIRLIVLTQSKMGKVGTAIPKNKPFVERYHFELSGWYQETWYKNLVGHIVPAMLEGYKKLKEGSSTPYQRSYGNCISYFRPCFFKEHCTEASWQNVEERYGLEQLVFNKDTGEVLTLAERRKELGLGV